MSYHSHQDEDFINTLIGTTQPSQPRYGRPQGAAPQRQHTFGQPRHRAQNGEQRRPFRRNPSSRPLQRRPDGRPVSRFGRSANRGFGGGNRQKRRGNYIDPKMLINKAKEMLQQAPYQPTHTFADFKIHEDLKRNIIQKGYVTPTPIQDQSIPHALQGRDVLGIANTGTGKTAAFAIPLINKLMENPKQRVLIMAPTRELAEQINDEVRSFSTGLRIYTAIVIGGANMYRQIQNLRRRPQFVIGTPGRLKDLVQRNELKLGEFQSVVLDEMDRMLDMGFITDISHLMGLMPKERQTLFFSATITSEIERLIPRFLNNHVTVSVKVRETPDHIEQEVIHAVGHAEKMRHLEQLLKKDEFKKVIIFGATKRAVDRLSRDLYERGFKTGSLHGDKPQRFRQNMLNKFKANQLSVLVATDVASRGIDVSDITHVINYDMPNTYEDYVHRIGRTGRANQKGHAITFVEEHHS